MTVLVSIALDASTKADLDEMAKARGTSPDSVVAEALAALADDDRRLAEAVARARLSVERGDVFTHDEVAAHLRARRAEWRKAG